VPGGANHLISLLKAIVAAFDHVEGKTRPKTCGSTLTSIFIVKNLEGHLAQRASSP
jgi:hypothetical protein